MTLGISGRTARVSALAIGALAAPILMSFPAVAATTATIRASDLDHSLPVADGASGNASYAFLRDGVHVTVGDADSYVVLRWKVNQPLSSMAPNVAFSWIGTAGKPGIKYDVDATGDGTIDCELQGELGENFVRLNKTTVDFTGSDKASSPTFCEGKAPHPDGQGGYPNTGSFAEWSAPAAFGPAAKVVDGGISASGVVQDGVLQSVTFGAVTNVFTSDAAPAVPAALSAAATKNSIKHGKPLTIGGTVDPGLAGTPITLLKRVVKPAKGGKVKVVWKPVQAVSVGSDGSYTFVKKFKKKGVVKVRVQTSATSKFTSTTSRTLKVRVR